MLITTPDMGTHWGQQSRPPAGHDATFLRQEVSKLSKWLALDLDDQTSSQSIISHPPSLLDGISSGNFYHPVDVSSSLFPQPPSLTTYSSGRSQLSSDDLPSMGMRKPANRQQWNVNANPFRPTTFHVANDPLLMRPYSINPTPPGGEFLPSERHIGADGAQTFPSYYHQSNQHHQQRAANGQQQPQQYGAEMDQFQQDFFVHPASDNVWRNPDAEFHRWQQYTGTSHWGDPRAKVVDPIQRWQQFTDDDCVDMVEQVSKLEAVSEPVGWGDFPSITTGTFGRIQQQNWGGESSTADQPGIFGGGATAATNFAQSPANAVGAHDPPPPPPPHARHANKWSNAIAGHHQFVPPPLGVGPNPSNSAIMDNGFLESAPSITFGPPIFQPPFNVGPMIRPSW